MFEEKRDDSTKSKKKLSKFRKKIKKVLIKSKKTALRYENEDFVAIKRIQFELKLHNKVNSKILILFRKFIFLFSRSKKNKKT